MTTPLAQRFRGGVEVVFADLKLFVPALNRPLLKKHANTFRDIQSVPGPQPLQDGANQGVDLAELFEKQCAMVYDALLLNYPELALERFDDIVDMQNMQVAFPAACGNLMHAHEIKAKNAMAESLYGSSTGTQTPPDL
jgi:hypothetical protein